MLFILTGNIQTGKTRWLERVVSELEQRSTPVCGVIAPGVWVACGEGNARDTGAGTGGAYEKYGIDNVLLPSRERVVFARRNDAALRFDGYEQPGAWIPRTAEEQKRGLWQFDESAIAHVDGHFAVLAKRAQRSEIVGSLLVVDEFGQMELYLGTGLSNAVRLIDQGATTAFPHALIVVRAQLIDRALERFANAPWGGISIIEPSDTSQNELIALFDD